MLLGRGGGRLLLSGKMPTLCKADAHGRVPDSQLETIPNTPGMCMPMIWGWLRSGMDHSPKTPLGLCLLCISLTHERHTYTHI